MNALAELFKAILKSTFVGIAATVFFMAQLERYSSSDHASTTECTSECDATTDFRRLYHGFYADPDGGIRHYFPNS